MTSSSPGLDGQEQPQPVRVTFLQPVKGDTGEHTIAVQDTARTQIDTNMFVRSQIKLLGRALMVAFPTMALVMSFSLISNVLRKPPFYTDSSLFFAVGGLVFMELVISLSVGYELHIDQLFHPSKEGKASFVKQIPSAFVTVAGSIGTAVFAT
ncbi:hypothetical protein HDU67_000397, partial [Dinochytrium kinnereticum]